MNKLQLILLLCFSLSYLTGQNNNNIIIGKIDSINSTILNENRKILVHVPDDYPNSALKEEKYPVVYLLDGNAHFHSVVGMIKQLSTSNGNTICPKMIVVGILNTNRRRDLTPTKSKPKPPYLTDYNASISGGGDKFILFIEKELIPYIDSSYPTESYRMFIGHSLGGLTVMNTIVYKPELFNSYVAIDPSMWWDDKKLLNEIKNKKFDKRYDGKSLYLGIANTMTRGMDTIKVKKDTTYTTRQIRSLLELNSSLKKDTLGYLSFKGKYYGEDTHASVPLITEYDALRYIFDFYEIKINKQDLMNPEHNTLDEVHNYYIRISKEFGREIKPDQSYIQNKGYQLMDMQQFQKAEQFFKLNVANYPESFYAYNSLGDLYVATGDKEKAIENYKKSISLNKDSFSKEKLEKLQNE